MPYRWCMLRCNQKQARWYVRMLVVPQHGTRKLRGTYLKLVEHRYSGWDCEPAGRHSECFEVASCSVSRCLLIYITVVFASSLI